MAAKTVRDTVDWRSLAKWLVAVVDCCGVFSEGVRITQRTYKEVNRTSGH
ncbi:hypothetical protein GCM10023223_06120 [Stackebrandtia albiflava]